MAKYGVWMLERLTIQYSETGGSSRGMRAFMQELLPELRVHNPQLEIKEQPSTTVFHHPYLIAEYRNGRRKPVCVKNLSSKDIQERIYWLRNSHGRGQDYSVVSRHHLSRNPSIQGPWTASTFAAQAVQTPGQ